MGNRNFMQMVEDRADEGKFLCIGLDSKISRLPDYLQVRKNYGENQAQEIFNKAIVDATCHIACAYKPNLAFYPPGNGDFTVRETIRYIHDVAPGVPVILDAKWGDIGNTNNGYIDKLRWYEADAVTINPYVGADVASKDGIQPFLNLEDSGIIVLCKTSNKGSGEFQDLVCDVYEDGHTLYARPEDAVGLEGTGVGIIQQMPLYQVVAQTVAKAWNDKSNCGLVVGATYPEVIRDVRRIAGETVLLFLPGVGTQGAKAGNVVQLAANKQGRRFMVNNGSAVLFASKGEDFADAAAQAARQSHDEITAALAA